MPMKCNQRSFLSVVLLTAFAALHPASFAQEIRKLPLGPETNLNYASFSENFAHVAFVGTHGTRQVVYWDGKPGQDYDKVTSVSPVLSEDGLHCAYGARKGTQAFIVVDNKEYGPFDEPVTGTIYRGYGGGVPSKPDGSPYERTPFQAILFSPDGLHSAFLARKDGQTVAYEDGKQFAAGKLAIGGGMVFSSQGDHLAVGMQDPAQKSVTYYMDGDPGPVFFNGNQPHFTQDGRHLFYVAEPAPGSETFVLDGKPGASFTNVREVHVSNDGAHFAYVGALRQDLSVVIDGRTILEATGVWLSPDGAHSAYFQPATKSSKIGGQGAGSLVVDGTPGANYDRILGVSFTSDGHVLYYATANQKYVVVEDGKESAAYSGVRWPAMFSHDGKHWAYVASDQDGSFLVLDGKPMQHFDSVGSQSNAEAPMFLSDGSVMYHAVGKTGRVLVRGNTVLGQGDGLVSPDGRRVALLKRTAEGTSQATAQVILDGAPGPVFTNVLGMVFSPDSRHFAYVGGTSGQMSTHRLYVDGTPRVELDDVGDVGYSPDSRHLTVVSVSHASGKNDKLYLDEKPVLEMPATAGYERILHWSDDGRQFVAIGRTTDHTITEVMFGEVRASANTSGAVDRAETHRMLGSGNMNAFAVTGAPNVNASRTNENNIASSAAGRSNSIGGSGLLLASGTTVAVRLLDAVDSSHPSQTAHYRAELTTPITQAGRTIVAGSAATVELTQIGNEWTLSLATLTVDGNQVATGANQMAAQPRSNAVAQLRNSLGGLGGLAGGLRGRLPSAAGGSADKGGRLILVPGSAVTFTIR